MASLQQTRLVSNRPFVADFGGLGFSYQLYRRGPILPPSRIVDHHESQPESVLLQTPTMRPCRSLTRRSHARTVIRLTDGTGRGARMAIAGFYIGISLRILPWKFPWVLSGSNMGVDE